MADDGALGFFGVPPVTKQPAPDALVDGALQLADTTEAINQMRAALFA